MPSSALDTGTPITWSHNRGRNGWDSPKDILQDQVSEAMNVVLQKGTLGIKRRGSANQPITGSHSGGYNALARFVPGQNDAAAELHFVDRSWPPKFFRVAAGTAAVDISPYQVSDLQPGDDMIADRPQDAHAANLNGKLYWAYKSRLDRLHVYDPHTPWPYMRRVGIAAPAAAPFVFNENIAGTYPAIPRRYKVAWRMYQGANLKLQSELSPETIFTPAGTYVGARVAKPTHVYESETHWVVYGATATIDIWYELAELTNDVVSYLDTELPTDYNTNEAEPVVGTYGLWPSVKYLLSTGDRLVGFGAYEPTTPNGRVYISNVLDTTASDDDERISNILDGFRGYLDLSRNAGAEDRGLVGPIDGQILVGQSRGVYLLVGTGDPDQPFRRITLSPLIGMVNQPSSFMGEDENGAPCAYWLDESRGPMRYGRQGLQWCGYDVKDVWDTVHLSATIKVAHGVYHPDLKACFWWIATGSADEPDHMIVLFTREGQSTSEDGMRYGWVRWDGEITRARCSVLFASTFGAQMSRRLSPYGGTVDLYRVLDPDVTTDGVTEFQATITSRAFAGRLPFVGKTLGLSYLLAQTSPAVEITIAQTIIRNFGLDETDSSTTLEPRAVGQQRVLRKFEDAEMTDAGVFQIKLGDAAPIANHWALDEWFASIEETDQEG